MQNASNTAKTFLGIIRGDVRRLPPVVLFTIFSISLYNFGWGFADSFFSLYFQQFSSHYGVIGLFSTLQIVAGLLILIPLGDLLDRVRHDIIINGAKFGYFIVSVCYFFAGEWHSLPLLVVALLINGTLMPFVWTGTAATLRDYSTNKNAALTYGLYIAARQFAWIIGLGISLWLVGHFPIHYIFIPPMIFPLLSILLSRKPDEHHHQPFFSAVRDVVVTDKVVGKFFQEAKTFPKELWIVYGLSFCIYATPVVALSFLPLYANSVGFSLPQIGLLALVMNIPFLFSFFAAELADHYARLQTMVIGLALSAASVSVFFLWHSTSWVIFLFGFLFIAGYAIAMPALSALVTVLSPRSYSGTASALNDLIFTVAFIVFPPVIGFIIDDVGWYTFFWICAIFLAVLTLVTVYVHHIYKKRNILHHKKMPSEKDLYAL